jgi:hypothetical protein
MMDAPKVTVPLGAITTPAKPPLSNLNVVCWMLTSISDPVIGTSSEPALFVAEAVFRENVLFTISMAIPELEAL